MIAPQHVAIIMDGNGRWGVKKGKSRNHGHKQGVLTVEKIINASINKNIKFLTLYTFSTENWKRPTSEIKFLMNLLETYIDKEMQNFKKKGIKLKIIGNLNKFSKRLKTKLLKSEKETNLNYKIQLNIALNYGSRQEIVDTVKNLKKKRKTINEKNISTYLYTGNIPDPEILIRTGNTKRLSNFLLWQSIYSEIFFIKKLWPDFTQNDFYRILKSYNRIDRKFGGL